MAELCLMASRSFHPLEYLPGRFSKDSKHFLSNFGFNHDHDIHKLSFGQRMHKMELGFKPTNGMLEYEFSSVHPNMRRPLFIDYQDFPPNLLLNLTAKPYVNHERALRFFLSRPSDGATGAIDMSKLFDLVGPQATGVQMPQQPLPPYYPQLLLDAESRPSLLYPITEFSSERPLCIGDLAYSCINRLYEDQLLVANSCIGMKYMPGIPFEVYSLNNANYWKKQQMLVPYFDRRVRKASKTNSHVSSSVVEPVKRKLKNKGLPKKKKNNKASKERDHCRNNYLHECESLLSIMVDKKLHGRTLINFLKRSGPEIPKLLTQFSASIAGTGLAVVFSVVCKVVYGRVPFCASKLLSTGLGLGLVWLSSAVNKLRGTVISINKNHRKLLSTGDEEMMSSLDRDVREIYFRAVTIMAVAFLRFA